MSRMARISRIARIAAVLRDRSSGSPEPEQSVDPRRRGFKPRLPHGYRSARACPSPDCLKQDGQDEQDLQDGAAWACGEKVWKTLMSIETAGNKMTRSERTLMRSGFWDACEGQALALRLRRRAARATVGRGPSRLYQRDTGFPVSPTLPSPDPETVVRDRPIPNRSRSGDLDLQRGPKPPNLRI